MIRLKLGRINQDVNVAQQSVSQAGMVGESLVQVGQQVANTGQKIGSIVERRRAEEARDVLLKTKTQNEVDDAELMFRLEDRAKDDPDGIADEYEATTRLRHEKMLGSIKDERVRKNLKVELDAQRQINAIKMRTFENKKKTDNYFINEQTSSIIKGQSYYDRPVGDREFSIDYDTRMASIDLRDMDDERKMKLKTFTKKAMVQGNLEGIMKGGQIQDFARAKRFVDAMPEDGIPFDKEQMIKKINDTRNYKLNQRAAEERQNRVAMEKAFDSEKFRISEVFETVIADPNANVEDQLKIYKIANKFNLKSYNIVPEGKMTDSQKAHSKDLLYSTLESMAESPSPLAMKDQIYNQTLTGQMSAEDGLEAIKALDVMTDSGYRREEIQLAKADINASFRKSLIEFNKNDKAEKARMTRQMYTLMRNKGLSPSQASKIVVHTQALEKKANVKIDGFTGNMNDAKELTTYGSRIKTLLKDGKINEFKANGIGRNILQRIDYLNTKDSGTPTFDEIMSRSE